MDADGIGLATLVATAIATAAAVVVTIWGRWIDRREADWAFLSPSTTWSTPDDYGNAEAPGADADVANAGDGAAFRVRMKGVNCAPRLLAARQTSDGRRQDLGLVPIMRPGDEVHLRVECDPRLWNIAEVHIEWIRSPTWRKRRSGRVERIPLRDIASRPQFQHTILDEATGALVTTYPEPDLPPLTEDQQTALEGRPRRLRLPWRH